MPLTYIAATLLIVAILAWFVNTRTVLFGGARNVVNVCLGLIVIGVVLGLINTYVPMAGSIKTILNIVVVIATVVGILRVFGLWDSTLNYWNDLTHRAGRSS